MSPSYVLVPHHDKRQVLLFPGEAGWTLPEISSTENLSILDLARANAVIQHQFSSSATTLQAMFVREPVIGEAINIFTVESHDPAWLPPATGRWFGPEALADLPIALPTHRSVIEAWFAALDGVGPPAFDIPWWRCGWFGSAAEWICRELDRLGFRAVGPVEQVKCWYVSAVLRVKSEAGDLYFKAALSVCPHEVRITQMLAERYPACTPAVLAVDLERCWMLMRGFQGPLLRDVAGDAEDWDNVLDAYAQIQRDSLPDIERFLALGCSDLRLSQMAASVDPLIAGSRERLHGGLHERLTEAESSQLQARAPQLKAMCEELEGCGIPPALEHGDLHAGNIALEGGTPLFFDWAAACVTHPFFCLGDLLADDDWFPTDPGANARLRDAYLRHWLDHGSMDRLLAAFRLSEPLRPLFHALQSDRSIAAYQKMLGGEAFLAHTASGWSMWQMQWWLADALRQLIAPESIRRL
jgi:Phosphotransferase enzyme family